MEHYSVIKLNTIAWKHATSKQPDRKVTYIVIPLKKKQDQVSKI